MQTHCNHCSCRYIFTANTLQRRSATPLCNGNEGVVHSQHDVKTVPDRKGTRGPLQEKLASELMQRVSALSHSG